MNKRNETCIQFDSMHDTEHEQIDFDKCLSLSPFGISQTRTSLVAPSKHKK